MIEIDVFLDALPFADSLFVEMGRANVSAVLAAL